MRPLRNSLFAFGFGAVAALGHAPFGLWWAALAGFAGLIWAVTRGPRPAFAAWAGGAGYFGLALHWIVEPFLVDAAMHGWMAPFALILMAGGLAAFWGLAAWLAARVTPGAVGLALWLALAELARGHVLTGFPWALPAYVWADTPLRMAAAQIGPYGLTLATLLICALPVAGRGWAARGMGAVVAAGLLAAAFLLGAGQGAREVGATGAAFRIVQPNVPQREKWDPVLGPAHAARLLQLTEGGDPALILWPESAVTLPLDMAGETLAGALGASGGVPVLTGINRRDGEDWFNAAVIVTPAGVVETYDKVHLVPFGEYIPFRSEVMRRLAGFSGFGFSPGAAVRAVDTPLGRAVVHICYEAIFPGQVRRAGERPRLLVQITNDAWFGRFAGPYQHLIQARFRAAEEGLPLIRAANTGVSAVIDAYGRVVTSLPLDTAGVLDATLPGALSPTPYSRLGDRPVAIILLLAIGFIAIGKRRRG